MPDTRASQVIYCDYNATAPLRRHALDEMLPWFKTLTGNPSSGHAAGQTAASAVAQARESVAELIGARTSEIVFTSGATEANNLALHAALAAAPGATLIVSAVEHPAVLSVADARQGAGNPIEIVGVDRDGALDMSGLQRAIDRAERAVVSIMAANNETGVLFDLEAISVIVRSAGALLHTDATQQVGRLPCDVTDLGVDMLSMSAHKFGGPMGAGALYISRSMQLPVHPLVHGGEQERGWRSGTLNVPGIVGFGAAASAVGATLAEESARISSLRDRFEALVLSEVGAASVNGDQHRRLPGTSSVTFADTPAQAVLAAMPDIAASDGSACAFGALRASHVLLAMGRSDSEADSVVRFSFGHASSESDIEVAARRVADAVARVRRAVQATAGPTAPDDMLRQSDGERRRTLTTIAAHGGTS